jgi:chromosome segregation ATPase
MTLTHDDDANPRNPEAEYWAEQRAKDPPEPKAPVPTPCVDGDECIASGSARLEQAERDLAAAKAKVAQLRGHLEWDQATFQEALVAANLSHARLQGSKAQIAELDDAAEKLLAWGNNMHTLWRAAYARAVAAETDRDKHAKRVKELEARCVHTEDNWLEAWTAANARADAAEARVRQLETRLTVREGCQLTEYDPLHPRGECKDCDKFREETYR